MVSGLSLELERSSSALVLRGRVAVLSITGDGKWQAAERKSEGVVVAVDGRDNTTRPERRASASSMHDKDVEEFW